ncbi:hypothetical protein LNQ49_10920 [Flavobacterium sp. F-65]|jgi:hypothetical protein|uniref:Bacteriocin-type signal sequence-containing protein n=1 Tax=Flavobacterium pisciphilum TaxID=2893755 RepID=A0ABS8MTH9_9FLAO|nr:hypothetical protein [Flavobacterium sp. F-65]MCC9072091.1 hypothetical protein [Flavobacterium sp. F-65]
MLKNILNLEGAQELSKNEQKRIKGSTVMPKYDCASGFCMNIYKNCVLCKD